MSEGASDPASDYFVVTKRPKRHEEQWIWEILRRSTPLGVKICGGGFRTTQAAKLAGEKALKQLLEKIAQEESRGA